MGATKPQVNDGVGTPGHAGRVFLMSAEGDFADRIGPSIEGRCLLNDPVPRFDGMPVVRSAGANPGRL